MRQPGIICHVQVYYYQPTVYWRKLYPTIYNTSIMIHCDKHGDAAEKKKQISHKKTILIEHATASPIHAQRIQPHMIKMT